MQLFGTGPPGPSHNEQLCDSCYVAKLLRRVARGAAFLRRLPVAASALAPLGRRAASGHVPLCERDGPPPLCKCKQVQLSNNDQLYLHHEDQEVHEGQFIHPCSSVVNPVILSKLLVAPRRLKAASVCSCGAGDWCTHSKAGFAGASVGFVRVLRKWLWVPRRATSAVSCPSPSRA